MNYLIDTHTHTLASGHAYNTMDEMTRQASEIGLAELAVTDHAPKMPGSVSSLYFSNLKVVRREKFGVRRWIGCEANICNFSGKLDLSRRLLSEMDIVIASFHIPCIQPGSTEQNTAALGQVLQNPYVDIIGHPDDGRYPVDMEALVRAAGEHHKLLELNNASLRPDGPRVGTRENDLEMLKWCKSLGVCIALGSDAHVAEDICNFENCEPLLEQADFPERLIVNTDLDLFRHYLDRTARGL